MGGFAKNKGSVAMRFKIDQTSFAFLNCHLAHGDGQIVKRIEMLQLILEQAFLKAKFAPDTASHNLVFVFGDLNFRISLKNQDCRNSVANIEYLK